MTSQTGLLHSDSKELPLHIDTLPATSGYCTGTIHVASRVHFVYYKLEVLQSLESDQQKEEMVGIMSSNNDTIITCRAHLRQRFAINLCSSRT